MAARHYNNACPSKATPERTCIVTRVVHDQDKLIRFALSPKNEIVPDITAKLPGRGVWVLNSRQVLETAIVRRAFDRAWRRRVEVPEDLVVRVDSLLERHALDALSLANKAGCVTCGYTNVSERVINAHNITLLQAADASDGGRQKLARKYRAICDALKIEPQIVDIFTVRQISLSIGKPNVVHAAIICEKAAEKFIKSAMRTATFRSNPATENETAGVATRKKSPSEQGE